jgi:DNA invertase Pin-like site-specific DNA recombinase
VIADIRRGDYTTVIVTDSSRLDRQEDVWAQLEIVMQIRLAGGVVESIAEPQFGKDDFGSLVTTVVAQKTNAEKSRKIKDDTYRKMRVIKANNAHRGTLPVWWATKGERYNKQAYCTDPIKVRDVYERAANGESMSSIAKVYDLYAQRVKTLLMFTANYTGVINCQYTHEDLAEHWQHQVTPIVDSELWHNANRARKSPKRSGRRTQHWISGVIDCPECGYPMYLKDRPAGPMLYCSGPRKTWTPCGRFKGCSATPIMQKLDSMFRESDTPLLAYQRVTGNQHELDELEATLDSLQATLSTVTDRQARRDAISAIEAAEDQIEAFTVVPDTFDYAPTGKTLADLWAEEANRHSMLKAIKQTMGLDFYPPDDIYLGVIPSETVTDGIVDLGGGICFRLA